MGFTMMMNDESWKLAAVEGVTNIRGDHEHRRSRGITNIGGKDKRTEGVEGEGWTLVRMGPFLELTH